MNFGQAHSTVHIQVGVVQIQIPGKHDSQPGAQKRIRATKYGDHISTWVETIGFGGSHI
jgi:hypothetical protein